MYGDDIFGLPRNAARDHRPLSQPIYTMQDGHAHVFRGVLRFEILDEFFQDLLRFGRIGWQLLNRRAIVILLTWDKGGRLRISKWWRGAGFLMWR